MKVDVNIEEKDLINALAETHKDDVDKLLEIVDYCTSSYDSMAKLALTIYNKLPEEDKGWLFMQITEV